VKAKNRHHPLYFRLISLAGLMLVVCTALRSTSINDPRLAGSEPTAKMSTDARMSIVQYASQYVGTPYRYGGTSPKSGFDCSGFTCHVLSNFDLSLPHTSRGQSTLGRAKKFNDAQPGDLLFFGKGKHIQHVAIVVQNNRKELLMVHSSTSRGVIIENVKQSDYWKKRILFAVDVASL
jgi:cell wall-associated NlpC family hydrolase